MRVNRNIINVVRTGTVKSSHVLGETISTTVANTLVINEIIKANSIEIWAWVMGFVTPKNVKATKQRTNPLPKKAKEPSNVLTDFIHGIFMFTLPYLFPIIDAIVSETIINNIPAIGKYNWLGANITNKVINPVRDKQ